MNRPASSPHPEPVEGRGRDRRALILGAGASGLAVGYARGTPPLPPPPASADTPLARIEAAMGGRLGVFAIDLETRRRVEHRFGERFPMCSSFKALLVGAILERVDQGRLALDQKIPFGRKDILPYAPMAKAHLAEGALSVKALCAAAVSLSDNTAANLLLAELGGPAELTAALRRWGDPATRLDRNEPELNESRPGDPRDTTVPIMYVGTLQKLIGHELSAASEKAVLTPASGALLRNWMIDSTTGLDKLRSGLPSGAVVGDKTGNNGRDTLVDIAFVELPGRKPILIGAFLTEAKVDAKAQAKVFADVARVVIKEFTDSPSHG